MWYDSEKTAVLVEVSEIEQIQIAAMTRDRSPRGRYAKFPANDSRTDAERRAWMEEEL